METIRIVLGCLGVALAVVALLAAYVGIGALVDHG